LRKEIQGGEDDKRTSHKKLRGEGGETRFPDPKTGMERQMCGTDSVFTHSKPFSRIAGAPLAAGFLIKSLRELFASDGF
jgi:hypothetical protein